LTYVIAFIVLLGALVFIHELGHFLMARLFGVGVITFSLGFGPKIVSRVYKGTEYRISWIPLGGLVKMVGEDPAEDVDPELKRVSFSHKPIWQRAIIVAAGPAFNVLLAFVLFLVVFAVGYPRLQPIVGTVIPGSPAQAAGLTSGDRIVSIDGRAIRSWEAMESRISGSGGKALALGVERDGARLDRTATPRRTRQPNIFGAQQETWAIGISPDIDLPYVGVPESSSPAGRAGLRSGDRITKIGGEKVVYTYQFRKALVADAGRTVPIEVARENVADLAEPPSEETAADWKTVDLTLAVPQGPDADAILAALGVEDADLYLLRVVPGGRADKAGFKAGDKVLDVGGTPVMGQPQFLAYVRGSGDKDAVITVQREGKPITLTVVPELKRRETDTGEAVMAGRIGVVIGSSKARGSLGPERYLNPFKLVVAAGAETGRWLKLTVEGIYYIASGGISVRNIGGPLRIAKIAGDTARAGLFQYIVLMAMISLNLTIINLIPLPILDGGNLLLFGVEAVMRRPLTMRTLQVVQWMGLAFLLLLIVFVFYNDLSYFFPQIGKTLQ
jgi:regulator of sigma E protease